MRIFLISLPDTYESLKTSLEAISHVVYLYTDTTAYSGVDWAKADVLEKIEDFGPDIVVNNMPALFLPSSSDYTYIGNSTESANLELKKWETRNKARDTGFLLPTVLEECTMNTVSTSHTDTVFLKPKGITKWPQAWRIASGESIDTHNSSFPADIPAYVEADLQHDIEAGCIFTMRDGSFQIVKTQGYTSRGEEKSIFRHVDWKDNGVCNLTAEQDAAVRFVCTNWLNYAALHGGTYEGEVCVALKGTEVYWLEQNSRRGTFATFTGSAQDWLDSLTSDVSKASSISWDFNF